MASDPEKRKAYKKEYREKNKEKVKACEKEYYAKNREKMKASHRAWHERNKEKEKARVTKYDEEHREQRRTAAKARYEKNKDKLKAIGKKYHEKNKEKRHAARRLSRFGLSDFDYNRMSDAQGFSCAICNGIDPDPKGKPGKAKTLHIDHSHTTGKVRGLLCNGCNTGLGHMKDSISRLQSAIQYLFDNQ